ncbi:MAG: PilZ domain-containing protein [bacterium]|nr:PilZ domain-containing protein [bacterium]
MIKRKNLRVNKKLMVSISENGFDGLGLTQNISRDGMCVVSETQLIPHRRIGLSVAVPGEVLDLKGEIMWSKGSIDRENLNPDQVGIRILDAPPEYDNYVEFIKHLRLKPGSLEL